MFVLTKDTRQDETDGAITPRVKIFTDRRKKIVMKNGGTISLGFDNEAYPAGTHMCLIYNDEAERRKIITKFLEGGLKTGEKVTCFVNEISPLDVRAWLEEMDIAIPDKGLDAAFTAAEARKSSLVQLSSR